METSTNDTGTLLDQITVGYGPAEVIGEFFLRAAQRGQEVGVTFRVRSDMRELLALNERERKHWFPLSPIFNANYHDLHPGNSYWIEGRNAAGEPVVAQAGRIFQWDGTNAAEEFRSMRIFYGNPAVHAPGAACAVTAPSASSITGRVTFSGGTWFRPDYRRLGLSTLLPRISRSYAFTRFNSDFTLGNVEQHQVENGLAARYGYSRIEKAVDIRFPHTEYKTVMVWMPREELIEDIARFSSKLREDRARGGDAHSDLLAG
jgi:hypothetical protein